MIMSITFVQREEDETSRHFSLSLIDRLGSLSPFGGVLNLTRR